MTKLKLLSHTLSRLKSTQHWRYATHVRLLSTQLKTTQLQSTKHWRYATHAAYLPAVLNYNQPSQFTWYDVLTPIRVKLIYVG